MDSPDSESTLPSRIASLVHAHFDGLPPRSKPTVYPDGSREWIPMAGIVVVKGENTPSEKLSCVTVTTGAKCLPASQIPKCKGLVLHDWHAEILALRAFNHWLLSECHVVLAKERQRGASSAADTAGGTPSPFIRWKHTVRSTTPTRSSTIAWPPFELQPDIRIYMYCTCAPCGDASMELCMAAQDDPSPWETTTPESQAQGPDPSPETDLLDGRGYFSRLGIVRRKPARADAEATRSKSCSDKLALHQVSSLLSYETSLLVAPTDNAYIAGYILPEEEISRAGCARCFSETGRMKPLKGRFWPESHTPGSDTPHYGYRLRPFEILSVPTELVHALWTFRKPKPMPELGLPPLQPAPRKSKPGNVSAVWTAAPSLPLPLEGHVVAENGAKALPVLRGSKTGLYETIINGVKQGNRAASVTPRGASALSRAKLWAFVRDTVLLCFASGDAAEGGDAASLLLQEESLLRLVNAYSYENFKKEPVALTVSVKARKDAVRDTKEALKGWVPNEGDEDWGLDVLIDTKKRKR
ncbi:tRNA-specific adenosine deaminase [Aspergillus clavatus NRRL 1]|uniref:tRNA-specific adenosine deaminase, putative n=1 Tax=Aspergillus clavatus (strain ATCC 1007 / CBS 513.65 / DSM 816 / NCTC 3887 / NRRL 1 / QM 1276 / 107) TaxID=344612 RepID=A1CR92_ASPCL|nr:tRNA-specific adenosine deaminase, putative [Aspergillus clavatus NRRL 1]EAW08163.1 tRNA-specific adenosine deaminase, putative [Aspergillus clavatus NRRL 1]